MAHSNFFFDTQNPNPSLERKMGDVLCIFSNVRLFILDMDEILSSQDYKEGTSLNRPPVKRILTFVDSGLPLGMGFLKFGNFLYMFGGEYPSVDSSLLRRYEPIVFGGGIPKEKPPCPVFRLDLTNDLSEPVPLRPMLGPKLYAIVEEIGGKIYVLSGRFLSSRLPMFEVLNPMTEEWRTLPSPFEPSGASRIQRHCVSGNNIICEMQGSYIYRCFSIVTETWEYTEDISSREEMAMSRDGKFDVRYEDVHLSFSGENGGLWAMRPWPKGKGFSSNELLSYDIEPHVPDFEVVRGPILADTSEQVDYMCGLATYWNEHHDSFALYVFVFQVEKLESEKVPQSQERLSLRYLRRQVYDFTDIEWKDKHIPLLLLNKAVIGRLSYNASTGSGECSKGEAKRKRKRKEDDDEDEEGQAVSTHGLP